MPCDEEDGEAELESVVQIVVVDDNRRGEDEMEEGVDAQADSACE